MPQLVGIKFRLDTPSQADVTPALYQGWGNGCDVGLALVQRWAACILLLGVRIVVCSS